MAETLPIGTTHPRGIGSLGSVSWPLVASSELFDLQYGKALVAAERGRGNVPVYGTNGRCGYADKTLFSGPGVILGRKGQGPLGVEWSEDDYWVIDTAYSLRPKRADIDLKFAYYLIKFVGLNHLKDGTSNPTLSRASFGAQAFPWPPLSDQQKIAGTLRVLDDKIELDRRQGETLVAMVRSLFKSWFVDFDPVHAKVEGRPTGMSDDLASLFPASFAENGLPKGWQMRRFSDLFAVSGGNTPRTNIEGFWNGPHQWATPKDLSGLTAPVLLQTDRQLTDAGLASTSSGLLPAGTLLMSTRAPIGYLAFIVRPTAINQGFAGIVRKDVSTAYAWAWCQANMDAITSNAGGSTFPEISKSVLRELPMLAPPQSLLDAFGLVADTLMKGVITSSKDAQTLAYFRDALIPKLMSGELRVADAEAQVSAA